MRSVGLDASEAGFKVAGRNNNNPRCADDSILITESIEELKSLLKVKEDSDKAGLKLNFQKTKMIIWFHHFIANRWGKIGSSDRFDFLGFQITADGDCSHEVIDTCS